MSVLTCQSIHDKPCGGCEWPSQLWCSASSRSRARRREAGRRPIRPPIPGAAKDVRELGAQLETIHPDVFRNISKRRFRSEVDTLARRAPSLDPNQLLVGLMRIAALPGDRNGHTGLFPLQPHRRELHLYPLRLYDFADGVYVVDEAGAPSLTGLRVIEVAGLPIEQVLARVRPLVPHDNESSLRALAPHYALVAEVLAGLGVTAGVGPVEFTFERTSGERFEQELTPSPDRPMRRSSPIRCTVTTRRYFPSAPARSTSPARGASSTSASSPGAACSTSATTARSHRPSSSRPCSNGWRGPAQYAVSSSTCV